MYYIIYSFLWVIALLPMRLLYVLSDIYYLVVYYLVGYRKNVVRVNLSKSFPEKSDKERLKIERQFFRFFCDLFVETIKEINFSKGQIKQRMTYGNLDEILSQHEKGKSVMIMTAHYGNWEWTLAYPLSLPENYTSNPIYQQQSNKKFDNLINAMRSKFGANLIERKELLRTMFQLKKENNRGSFWMISDQTPTGAGVHTWMQFLNQDTAVITGTEQLAMKFDYPVFYAEITRKKRGYYHCDFIPVAMEPAKTEKSEITGKYMELLEKSIRTNPQYWLWSHNRWKYARR